MAQITFRKDEMVKKDDVYKSHVVSVCSGEPANSVSLPPAKRKAGVVRPVTSGKLLRPGGPSQTSNVRPFQFSSFSKQLLTYRLQHRSPSPSPARSPSPSLSPLATPLPFAKLPPLPSQQQYVPLRRPLTAVRVELLLPRLLALSLRLRHHRRNPRWRSTRRECGSESLCCGDER